MGFLKGFIVAIPIGLYFGSNNLSFPIVYKASQIKNRKWGSIIIDLRFMDNIERQYHAYIDKMSKKNE